MKRLSIVVWFLIGFLGYLLASFICPEKVRASFGEMATTMVYGLFNGTPVPLQVNSAGQMYVNNSNDIIVNASNPLPVILNQTVAVNATIQGTPNVNATIQGTVVTNSTIQGTPSFIPATSYGTITAYRTNIIANDTINATNMNAIAVNMSTYSTAIVRAYAVNSTDSFVLTACNNDTVKGNYSCGSPSETIVGVNAYGKTMYVPTNNNAQFAIAISSLSANANVTLTYQGANGIRNQ
jgi:hypothetical protein